MSNASVSDYYSSTATAVEGPSQGSDAASTCSMSSFYSNSEDSESGTISRSASSLQLVTAPTHLNPSRSLESPNIRRTFSATVLPTLENSVKQKTPSKYNPDSARGDVVSKLSRGLSVRSFRHSKITISKFAITEQPGGGDAGLEVEFKKDILKQDAKAQRSSDSQLGLTLPSSANNLRPSPPNRSKLVTQVEGTNGILGFKHLAIPDPTKGNPVKVQTTVVGGDATWEEKTPAKITKSRRPLSSLIRSASLFNDKNTLVSPVLLRTTSDKLPIPASRSSSQGKSTISSRTTSSERLPEKRLESNYKKDELCGLFRTLDGEYQKFISKPSTLKMNVIRTVLVPFLRTYSEHPSNYTLRAEDLEKRIGILNKWWNGLLELLYGKNGQSVFGNDRPAVLEAVTGIMLRPEWQLTLSSIVTPPNKSRSAKKSTTSLASTSDESLAESVLDTAHSIFVEKLESQMAFVVAKMSLRHVPASVVTFCGKATAYAFFFCPGMAEILVRLWNIPTEIIRRILKETGITRNIDMKSTAEKTAMSFPEHLRALSFKSLPSLMQHLRRRPQSSSNFTDINWHGPWASRWAGRDSELFFVFVKHFFLLTSTYLPAEASKVVRATTPGHILVQAQLLMVLDGVIHSPHHPQYSDMPASSLSTSFDDILRGEATAAALALPPPIGIRSMAENRLIMLLREFLLDNSSVNTTARRCFAESFGDLLKATSRRTSLYDHEACFTLCDLLEEAIGILARYYNDSEDPASFLDWSYWLDVFKRMMVSNNTMTEVRVYAFLYRLWVLITSNENRKKELCLDWLLGEDHFQRQFNHWCPMVRAYYHRLLCWRFTRLEGDTQGLNLTILTALSERLNKTWCHFIFVREGLRRSGSSALTAIPCNPAPARRLMIVRNDRASSSQASYLSLDGTFTSSSMHPTAYEHHHSLKPLLQLTGPQENERPPSPSKKRWGVLKGINPFTSASSERTKLSVQDNNTLVVPASSKPKQSATIVPPLLEGSHKNGPDPNSSDKQPPIPNMLQHQTQSFTFSLEWIDRSANHMMERRLYPPKLPLLAQSYVQTGAAPQGELLAVRPVGAAASSSKYCGRALAEWSLVVSECQEFFKRRKYEGVPEYKLVETPMLGVDSFRK
ncbi:MAG: hypothetical protein MMC33_000529 [Icmadophila ericetorum]|nr:hypothetical protein [Icmadophila ericetorum]